MCMLKNILGLLLLSQSVFAGGYTDAVTDRWLDQVSAVEVDRDSRGRIVRGEWYSGLDRSIMYDISEVEVTQIVTVGWVVRTQGYRLNANMVREITSDPDNFVAVLRGKRLGRGDRGVSEWTPSDPDIRCLYLIRFEHLANKYGYVLPNQDQALMDDYREECKSTLHVDDEYDDGDV